MVEGTPIPAAETAAPLPEVQGDADYEEVDELPSGHNDKAAFMVKLNQMRKPALSALLNNAFHIERNDQQVSFYFDINHANLIPLIRSARNRGHLSELVREFYGPNMSLAWYATNNPNFTKASEADAALRAKVSAHPIVKHILENIKGSIISCQVVQKKPKKKEQPK